MNNFLVEYKIYIGGVQNLADQTVKSYLRDNEDYTEYVKAYRGVVHPNEITLDDIRSYLASLNRKNLKPSSLSRKISAIKSFHKFLLLERHTTKNVAATIAYPKKRRRLPVVLSISEMQKLIEAIDGSDAITLRNRAMIELNYATGIRVSELLNIKLTDLHLEKGLLKVYGKGRKERIVPVGEQAIVAVKEYLKNARIELAVKHSSPYMFLNQKGNPLNRTMYNEILKGYAKRANITKKVTSHTIRHSFATHLLERGIDLRSVQELLGHANISTTELYTNIHNKEIRKIFLATHPRAQK